jgi:hydroxymethylpyrimidine/phosphomethylpyrimidine kinase
VEALGIRRLVVDPVMVAKSGDRLLRGDAVRALRNRLLPLAMVLTPNLPEAEVLLGRPIGDWDAVREAARELVALGAQTVVMKGGHTFEDGPPGPATDIFYDGHEFREYTAARVDTTSTHGTGCTFSAAIAAALAKGDEPRGAVALAKSFVTKALQSAYPVGHGHGPVHHFFRYWQPAMHEEEA